MLVTAADWITFSYKLNKCNVIQQQLIKLSVRLEVAIKNCGDLQGIEASFKPQSIRNKGLLGKVTIPLFFIMMDFETQIWQKLKLAGEATEAAVSSKSTTAESELYLFIKNKNKAKLGFGGIPISMPWHVKQRKKNKSPGMAEVAEKEMPQLNSVTTILQHLHKVWAP